MGANTSVQKQWLEDNLRNELKSSGHVAADCVGVQRNRIVFGSIENCNVRTENTCIAEASVDAEAMADAMRKMAQAAATDQEASGIVLLQANTSITETKTVTERINEIKQICEAKAETELEQENEIYPGDCKDSDYVFLNGGNAQANCMLRTIQNDFYETKSKQETKQLLEGFDFVTSGISSVLPTILVVLCLGGGLTMASFGGSSTGTPQPVGPPPMRRPPIPYSRPRMRGPGI